MSEQAFPALPYESWRDTKDTLHRFSQIVGKVALAAAPPVNHWWGIALHATPRGVTTGPLPAGGAFFSIDMDMISHRVVICTSQGETRSFGMPGRSVAVFHANVVASLDELGLDVHIANPRPFDLGGDQTPFAEDTALRAYDPAAVGVYHRILIGVDGILRRYSSSFRGKQSPVNHYWHTFDIAVGRFSGRRAPVAPEADAVTREAYSHEVIACGFWFGDERVPAPAFYSYTAPEPADLTARPLTPEGAVWSDTGRGHLALYMYDDARATGDVPAAALAFFGSAFAAGREAAGWSVDEPEV